MFICILIVFIVFIVIMSLVIFSNTDLFTDNYSNIKNIYVKLNWGILNRLRTIRKLYAFCLDNNINLYIIDNLSYVDTEKNSFPISIKEFLNEIPLNFINLNDLPTTIKKISNNKKCECEYNSIKKNDGTILISCCDFIHEKYEKDNRFYKLIQKNINIPEHIRETIKIIIKKKAVGVHIRQGSVFDYYQNNFFGSKTNYYDKEPYFCCFKETNKNLSYCPNNVVKLENFISEMNTYPKNTYFYVCSDRTGCILNLLQDFKDKIIYNPIYVHKKEIDVKTDFYDWYCLQFCTKLITTWQSSYSQEASLLYNLKKKNV